jgi:hypothetical protein
LWDGPAGSVPANRGMLLGEATQDFDGSNPSAVSGSGAAHSQGSVSGDQTFQVTLSLDNLPSHQHDFGLSSANTVEGLTAHVGTNYPAGLGEFLYCDDDLKGCDTGTDYGKTADAEVARTRLTGATSPVPISVDMEPATLWLFCMRKV